MLESNCTFAPNLKKFRKFLYYCVLYTHFSEGRPENSKLSPVQRQTPRHYRESLKWVSLMYSKWALMIQMVQVWHYKANVTVAVYPHVTWTDHGEANLLFVVWLPVCVFSQLTFQQIILNNNWNSIRKIFCRTYVLMSHVLASTFIILPVFQSFVNLQFHNVFVYRLVDLIELLQSPFTHNSLPSKQICTGSSQMSSFHGLTGHVPCSSIKKVILEKKALHAFL